ncbi:MAG: hypothetical protein GY711_02890 [bacterium]|nr:hypothetical protein [bacterium]
MWNKTLAALLTLSWICSCHSAPEAGPTGVEARSLLGRDLARPALAPERQASLEADLADARAAYARDPADELAAIWVGRRLAYLGRYQEAIEWYTRRLADFPDSYRLMRHRGHRLISVRELDRAIEDLLRAQALTRDVPDAVEPDGAPNRYGIPRSSTQSNIRYHLGLAFYLQGQFDLAADAFAEDVARAWNEDHLVAATNWLVASLRRAGRAAEARAALGAIRREMNVIENFGYHDLCKLYAGWVTPGEVVGDPETAVVGSTVAYGVANWRWCNGNEEQALEELRRIVDTMPWNAFGTIAAEADLARASR